MAAKLELKVEEALLLDVSSIADGSVEGRVELPRPRFGPVVFLNFFARMKAPLKAPLTPYFFISALSLCPVDGNSPTVLSDDLSDGEDTGLAGGEPSNVLVLFFPKVDFVSNVDVVVFCSRVLAPLGVSFIFLVLSMSSVARSNAES